jgi:hypothetical protein
MIKDDFIIINNAVVEENEILSWAKFYREMYFNLGDETFAMKACEYLEAFIKLEKEKK